MSGADKSFTKRLKHDINQKNAVRSEIERLVLVVNRWNNTLSKSKSFQEQSKYGASIKRYISKIESLRSQLAKMNDGIDRRISETSAYSTSEVENFKSQLGKEVVALVADDNSEKKLPVRKQSVKKRSLKKRETAGGKKSKSKHAGLTGTDRLLRKIAKMRTGIDDNITETARVTGQILQRNRQLGVVGKGLKPEGLTAQERNSNLFTQELKRIERERLVFGS
ncbi:MAG: hypothetical protein MRK01_11875 [Candidatus Scalindua sp.]|nr:hypothetical protein [Candidatus Scalindua sp.]